MAASGARLPLPRSLPLIAEVNAGMLTSTEWAAFQQSIDAQPGMAATLKLSGIAQMAGSFKGISCIVKQGGRSPPCFSLPWNADKET